jgi:hypothetical protein
MKSNFPAQVMSLLLPPDSIGPYIVPSNLNHLALSDLQTYQVRSRREIVTLLHRIGVAREPLHLFAPTHPDGIAGVMLEVDEAQGNMIFSLVGPGLSFGFGQQQILFETTLNHVRIFFYAAAVACTYRGRAAFFCAIPDVVMRIQRRESYRVPTQALGRVSCSLPEGRSILGAELYDISVGGIGVMDRHAALPSDRGHIHKDCIIHFPDNPLRLTLELRSVRKDRSQDDNPVVYLGYRFDRPGPRQISIIQNYVAQLEQRKNLARIGN